jgi:molybdopterin molybdotransferase
VNHRRIYPVGSRKTRMQQGFRENVRLDEALDAFLPLFGTVGCEKVGLDEATGRVAGSEIVAQRPVPHYDRSAMDGYAVRAVDTHGAARDSPARLDAVEGCGKVEDGETAQVHTGTAVPDGADAVVRVEDTRKVGETVEVSVAASKGENVAYTGEDVEECETVVDQGVRLRPSTVGVLRSVGVGDVDVRRKPRVAVVPTGDEVVRGEPEPGEVVGTNAPMVAGYVERWGGDPTVHGIVPDDEEALREAVADAGAEADLVATIGGSSVGDRDLLADVVDGIGEMRVHGVAVKPGHPVGFGVVGETPTVILPGYPVSCVVNSFEFVRRGVRALLGVDGAPEPTSICTLDGKVASDVGARTYTRVEIDEDGEGRVARPVRTKGAGVLSSVARADGFVVTPEEREGYASGEDVEALLWEA